jgi:hypothetical protein
VWFYDATTKARGSHPYDGGWWSFITALSWTFLCSILTWFSVVGGGDVCGWSARRLLRRIVNLIWCERRTCLVMRRRTVPSLNCTLYERWEHFFQFCLSPFVPVVPASAPHCITDEKRLSVSSTIRCLSGLGCDQCIVCSMVDGRCI